MQERLDRPAEWVLLQPSACPLPPAPDWTTDNSSQFSSNTAPRRLCARSYRICLPSSTTPDLTCCTEDTWPLPSAASLPLLVCHSSRSSNIRCGTRPPPELPALLGGAAVPAVPAGHSDIFGEMSGTLPPLPVRATCPYPACPSAGSVSSPLAFARTSLPEGKGRTLQSLCTQRRPAPGLTSHPLCNTNPRSPAWLSPDTRYPDRY